MDLFAKSGAHVLVDGQFGSTGKGLYASWLAVQADKDRIAFDAVISNAGPNSGHTFYHNGEKHVLKMLPSFAVKSALLGRPIPVYLSAGAVIDVDILRREAEKYRIDVWVHPNAAVITNEAKATEQGGSIAAVAGTRSGTGAAIAAKVFREPNAIFYKYRNIVHGESKLIRCERTEMMLAPETRRYFVEVSQGFSLGLNSEFYPKVTSRECTVMQAIADARIAPRFVNRTYMVARTYPIRVGNVDGFSSGDCYEDQQELSWSDLGQTPELTTVTQRVRRVFTFSRRQYIEALAANRPDFVLLNFMNYFKRPDVAGKFAGMIERVTKDLVPDATVVYGWGPNDEDIHP